MNVGSFYMSNKAIQIIHRVYGIVLSLSLLLAGICLMAGCLSIYNGGEPLYSREQVAETFSAIAVPVCIFPVLALLGIFLPGNLVVKGIKRNIPAGMILGKELSYCDESTLSAVKAEQRGRRIRNVYLLVLSVLCGLAFVAYALTTAHRDGVSINEYVIGCMRMMVPCLLVPFGFGIYASLWSVKSLARQWELVKKCPNLKPEEAAYRKKEYRRKAILVSLAAVSVALIVIGRATGGAADVLTKAINICTECIGLG